MKMKTQSKSKTVYIKREEVEVSAFRSISIHFPNDVYTLAVWVALSDKARSTPRTMRRTTLQGFAQHFLYLYGTSYENPMTIDKIKAVFVSNGITGNPTIYIDQEITKKEDIGMI